jgi:hypothetical protein
VKAERPWGSEDAPEFKIQKENYLFNNIRARLNLVRVAKLIKKNAIAKPAGQKLQKDNFH